MSDKQLEEMCREKAQGLKCPFCGMNNHDINWFRPPQDGNGYPQSTKRGEYRIFYVTCNCCHASSPELPNMDDAIAIWRRLSDIVEAYREEKHGMGR